MTRVASIDCGTNSIRLLVADVPAAGPHTDLLRRMEVVRLGEGVDRTGVLAPQAIERTRVVLAEYAAAASRLESAGRMREWQDELATDPELAAGYLAAHEAYLATRDARDLLPTRMTAGGMPDRVKCLHALAAHALAAGPGVNPIGDRAVEEMGEWWAAGPCAQPAPENGA